MESERRANQVLQAAVERGILIAQADGSAVAWAYMQAFAVPEGAIKRILAYPAARRVGARPAN
jgi:hypothetical protein